MAGNSKIEWTEATWNPIAGCSIVSPGCHNCYAMRTAARLEAMGQAKYAGTTKKANGKTLWTGKINIDRHGLFLPLRTRKPTTFFVNSMSDLFHDRVPWPTIQTIFAVMAACPDHTFQVLTKRAETMFEFASRETLEECLDVAIDKENHQELIPAAQDLRHSGKVKCWPLPNVWLGVSCEDQQRADERIPWLLKTPAAVRFLSCEPLLGPINLQPHINAGGKFVNSQAINCDWVIVGGESGPGARPCRMTWIRDIVRQCADAGVPCFIKQLGTNCETGYGVNRKYVMTSKKGGDMAEWPEDLRVRQFPEVFNV